jgi:signal transduction histidine kinase
MGDQLEALMMCQRESGRLKRLVSDLLDLARMEVGKLPLARQDVVLQEVVRATTRMFEDQIKQRGLQLSVELPAERAGIIGDQDRLQQVMINLLHNAIKFTQQGTITVRLTAEPRAYVIEVSDSGPGIAQGDLERVFDKFERVGAQTEEGSGLGLPIAKDIIKLHHGRMWVESLLGVGSRFMVQLPRSSGGDAPQSPTGSSERGSGNGERVASRDKEG